MRCLALAARGHARRVPARGRLPLASSVPANSARRPRAPRGPRRSTIRSGPGRTLTHPARVPPRRPPDRRGRGIQGNPVIRVWCIRALSRHRDIRGRRSPGRRRADRDSRMRGRRPSGHRARGRMDSHLDTSPPRSGHPPGHLVRGRAAASSRRLSSRGLASTVKAGQVPGRGLDLGRPSTARRNPSRPPSLDTGNRNLARGRPATGKTSSRPGSKDRAGSHPASSGPDSSALEMDLGQRVRDRSVRARRLWPGRTVRRPVRRLTLPARTAARTRTGLDSLAVRS